MERKNYYLNLTNGIEFLEENECENVNFVRTRSTTIERKDWLFLLMDLDHNFLMNLALGKNVTFVDYGTNRKNSKTIYKAIPLIEFILNKFWLDLDIEPYRRTRNSDDFIFDQKDHYNHIYDDLFTYNSTNEKNKLKTKLKYYKRFINTKIIKIDTIGKSTKNDGNYDYYSILIKNKY